MARVEKEYQAGVVNYEAGNTDAAKLNFDNAFNAMLGSNLDVRSDDRLQKEFDRVVAGVNELGLDGLGGNPGDAGNNPADAEDQQKSEPAPIDETNGITPSADASVRAKAQAEIKSTHSDLPLMMTDQVAGYISYFSNRGRGNFERAFARSGRYHDMMVSVLKEEGVPQDLIYLAQAESGFHPLAVSRVGARGIWQFMASRARGYGLSHNMYVDDRQDPEKSTRAAAHHLKDLYNEFGDWYLAMAAYNSGPGTVQSAVKRTGYADFWELYRRNVLPKETRNYVPIILAVTIMAKNPSQYGLERSGDGASCGLRHRDAYLLRSICDWWRNAWVERVERLAGSESQPAATDHAARRTVRVAPARRDERSIRNRDCRDSGRHAVVVALSHGSFWRHPGFAGAHLPHHGQVHCRGQPPGYSRELEADAKLVIPVAPGKHPLSDTATYARRITRYKVHSGDTVQTVAENFGVSPLMVRRWNGLRGDSLSGRRVLALHLPITPNAHATEVASARTAKKHTTKPATQTASDKPPVTKSAKIERVETAAAAPVIHHKVKTGETLYSIATYYKTTSPRSSATTAISRSCVRA